MDTNPHLVTAPLTSCRRLELTHEISNSEAVRSRINSKRKCTAVLMIIAAIVRTWRSARRRRVPGGKLCAALLLSKPSYPPLPAPLLANRVFAPHAQADPVNSRRHRVSFNVRVPIPL